MSNLNEKAIYQLKWNYNHNLNRFYNGCNYLEEHTEQIDKFLPTLLEIKESLELFLEEIMKEQTVTNDEVLNGFNLGGTIC